MPSTYLKLGRFARYIIANRGAEEKYNPVQMSEGERTALYLIARVVVGKSGIIIVDEPELYFHPLLARQLWDALEILRTDIRFVYITHDIAFGLSRRKPRFLIVKSPDSADLVSEEDGIPSPIALSVLGAASLSISATRVIFCEGKSGSFDLPILSAYYSDNKTAVVAAGGCDAVRNCVRAIAAGNTVQNLQAFGHIDRDTWPEAYLNQDQAVRPLPFYEIEGILLYEPIFLALAEFHGAPKPADLYNEIMVSGKNAFKDVLLCKEVLNRSRQRVEFEQKSLMNGLNPGDDLAAVEADFKGVEPAGGWTAYLGGVWSEETNRIRSALTGANEECVKILPSKSFYTLAASKLSVQASVLFNDIVRALSLPAADEHKEASLAKLKKKILDALEPHMWPRTT